MEVSAFEEGCHPGGEGEVVPFLVPPPKGNLLKGEGEFFSRGEFVRGIPHGGKREESWRFRRIASQRVNDKLKDEFVMQLHSCRN